MKPIRSIIACMPLTILALAQGAAASPLYEGRDVASCSECRVDERCGGSLFSGLFCRPLTEPELSDATLRALDGEYLAHVDFGAGPMSDRVRFERIDQGACGPRLTGEYVVPGKFTAGIEEPRIEGARFTFRITAREGGQAEELLYELEYDLAGGGFSGTVSEHGSRIGVVRLERAR